MKVLIARKDLKDTTSGVPNIVLQQIQMFKKLGFEVYAMAETINIKMIEEVGGFAVKTFKWPISGFFRRKFYAFNVDRWIKKNKPQIVIGHGDIFNQDILFIHNCVHLAHELIEQEEIPKDHEVGKIHSAIFKSGSFKMLLCNSMMMKNDLISRFNINPEKVSVMYPTMNMAKFSDTQMETSRDEWRCRYGFDSNDFVIGMITSGNFKKRNLALLIEAFKVLTKDFPQIKLFIAGGNIDQKYKDMAPKENVVFAPAITDVKFYYNLIDLFVLPAIIEEFGLSVLEAMYFKKPVITTKTVGANEIMEGSSRELVMEQVNLEELLKKLRLIITNKNLYQDIAEINFHTAKNHNKKIQNTDLLLILKNLKIIND